MPNDKQTYSEQLDEIWKIHFEQHFKNANLLLVGHAGALVACFTERTCCRSSDSRNRRSYRDRMRGSSGGDLGLCLPLSLLSPLVGKTAP